MFTDMVSKKELLKAKENHLKDLKECSIIQPIMHWIWVEATIKRLKKEIKELKRCI